MTDEESVHDSSLSLPLLDHIDSICTDFETAWQAVAPPSLEQYVGQARGVERPELLRELLRLELDYRNRRPRELSLETLQRQFPDDVQVIANVFRECIAPPESGAGPPDQPAVHGDATTANLDQTGTWGEEGDAGDTTCRLVGDTSRAGQRFRIKRSHAKGGLGEVFVARDQELHRDVALKEIQQQHADNAAGRSRFSLEAEVTARLEHPGIVPVYGLGTHSDGRPFYAMRLIHGESLQQAIEQFYAGEGERSVSERMIAFRQLLGRFVDVCQTIAYAHSRGVLHRDVKPSNIMLGKYGETLVVDWGLAKVTCRADGQASSAGEEPPLIPQLSAGTSPDTAMGATLGTPAYMSPEQASGQVEELGVACDVYSLGATLYTILTGRTPFAGARAADILRQVQAGEFTAPRTHRPTLSRALEAVCLKAMALEPHDRYASARALADDMEAWLADEPVSAYPEPAAQQLGRWVRRHRGLVLATSAAVVVAVIGLGVGNLLLAGKNRELKTANVEIIDAKQQADRRFTLALEAIENYYTGVSEDVVLKQPELSELRERLLRGSLDFYEKLREELEPAEDPASRLALADAYCAIARTCGQIAARERACQAYGNAVEMQEALAREFPTVGQYRGRLADSLKRLGLQYMGAGRHEDAASSLEKAREVAEELTDVFPNVPRYRSNLAEIYHSLCALPGKIQSREQAFEYCQRSVSLSEALAVEQPNDSELQCRLARIYNRYAIHLSQQGRRQDAKQVLEKAIEIHRAEAERHPEIPEHWCDLAKYHSLLSTFHKNDGNTEGALAAAEKAVQIREALATEYPNWHEFQRDLAMSYRNLGILHRASGHTDQAQDYLQKETQIREQLTADLPGEKLTRAGYVKAQVREADSHLSHGEPDKALPCQQAALRVQAELAREWPDNREYRADLGRWHVRLGEIQRDLGNLDEALKSYSTGVRIHEELANSGFDARANLAEALHSLGSLQLRMRDHDAALQSFQRTAKTRESLVQDVPCRPWDRFALMCVYHDLANLLCSMSKNAAEVEAAFETALHAGELLVQEFPAVDRFAVELGNLYCGRGHFARDHGQLAPSLDWFGKAIHTLRDVVQRAGGNGDARSFLCKAYEGRAASLTLLGRYQDSVGDWEEAITLGPKKRVSFQMHIARARALAKDHQKASSDVLRLVAEPGTSGDAYYAAARVLALSIPVAQGDTTLSADAREKLATRYSRDAIAALRKARDLGYFSVASCLRRLRTDSDLADLQESEAFEELLRSIE